MGLDITVLIADSSWLGEVPPQERLPRLRDAWYADETGLWDVGPEAARAVEGGWEWLRGTGGPRFGIYDDRFPDVVEHELAEAREGRFRWEPLTFHLAGVPSYLVVAELTVNQVLRGTLPRPAYPRALRAAAPRRRRCCSHD